ncbi:hypothetical protein PVK06_001438 [Gossypium arboreum]|uniref:BZIP domain-containing protein n=1 Tax=Gossypium arboreum TaxID=29729 RepID=A0ABR0R199_GOSAR|nr:hypothetical protein PVK06_001438 [Gossypium arboreum]
MLEKSVPQQQEIGIHNVVKETGSSSYRLNDQNKIIRNGGCLINPLGFPYRSRIQVLAADAPSGSGELLIMNDLPVYMRGRNKIQEAIEEAEQKKRKNKIKNRISAAKSRARSQEHTRFLEEKVEQLRNENALLKKLLSLEAAAAERLLEAKIEDQILAAEATAKMKAEVELKKQREREEKLLELHYKSYLLKVETHACFMNAYMHGKLLLAFLSIMFVALY